MAGSLLESLDEARDAPEFVEATWNEEIARRIDDLNSGRVKAVCLEEFRRKLSSAAE